MKVNIKRFVITLLIILLITPVVSADINLLSSLTHKYKVREGGEYSGKLVVVNDSSEAAAVKLYKRDYRFDAEGHSYYLQPGTLTRSNSSWIELNKNLVDIPAGCKKEIDYSIKVPVREDLTGTYWSLLMLEPQSGDIYKPLPADKESNVGVKQHYRYAVQIVTDIADSGKCNLEFENPEIIKQSGQYFFQLDFINQGESWLTPLVWLEVYNNQGKKIDKYYGQELRIYPGTSVCQQIKLEDIKMGEYKAVLIADCGNSAVFGSRYTLVIKEK